MRAAKHLSLVSAPETPAVAENGAWARATAVQRNRAMSRGRLIQPLLAQITLGVSAGAAVNNLLSRIDAGQVDKATCDLARELGRGGKPVSRATLLNWIKAYQAHGREGLLDSYKGRQRKAKGWEVHARNLIALGHGITDGAVARMLQQEGFDVQGWEVNRFRRTLPASITNRRNLSAREYRDKHKPHRLLTWENVPPGVYYISDGNCAPVYLRHPTGSRPWRAEITPVLDAGSRYWVGYQIGEFESGWDTALALRNAITREGCHVPSIFKSDGGPGFENNMLGDSVDGFYTRLGITKDTSIPGNPKGNGLIERFHRTVKDEFLKKLPGYCGKDASRDKVKQYLKRVKTGESQLMSLAQFVDALEAFRHWYNHERGHDSLGGATPASLWAQREVCELADKRLLDLWMRDEVTVRRGRVHQQRRIYQDPELEHYNGQRVKLEYRPYDGSYVRVLDLQERWLCDADLVTPVDGTPMSHLERAGRKKLEMQVRRLELKKQEKIDRSHLAITHEDYLNDLDEFEPAGGEVLPDRSNETAANFFAAADKPDPSPVSDQDQWDWDDFI
ncbi:MAG: hypothetical protein DWQ08_14345 [Proteobacteria bacterium]|nr:MAG: hypothetical protein DWQ08_14345 [Pseudomonadota bacterium]